MCLDVHGVADTVTSVKICHLDHSVSSLSSGRIPKDIAFKQKGIGTCPKASIYCQNLIISGGSFSPCYILIELGKELAINFCIINLSGT